MSSRQPSHWDEPLSPLCEHGKGYSCKHCRGVFPFPTEPLPHQTGYRSSGGEHQADDSGRQGE
ncbi:MULTISPECIES: hypothetical protein [Cupriavidus]|jgi:hypothetical protein|uniref:hypothetical protein n=1 Tax=Cupriavidus TaxID=106589 RepID=UPI000797D962|nr:hypothetical protein [Cupriavidus metallidurans]KWW32418.1 hypothetical protein AU374_06018 [Cupriavidus metallidurans]